MKLLYAWSWIKPRFFLITSVWCMSFRVNTLLDIKFPTVPTRWYHMYCWLFLAKPESRAFISSGSAFKMSGKVSLLKQNGATVWSNCNRDVMSLCFSMGSLLQKTIKAIIVDPLLKFRVQPKNLVLPGSLVFAGIWFARGRWHKEMILLELTRWSFVLYRSDEPLAELGKAKASPSFSLDDCACENSCRHWNVEVPLPQV